MFIETINKGFSLTHRNLQLVYIRISFIFINIVGFFVIVGLPVTAVVASIGIDTAHLEDFILTFIQDPEGVVSAYVGLILLVFISLMVYIAFVSVLHLYVLSGTLGVLKNSALKTGERFSFSSFFIEARRHFFLLLWLISITALIFFALLVIFSILSGIGSGIGEFLSGGGEFMKDFTDSFFSLFIMVFGGIIIAASLIFIVYSVAISVTGNDGVMDTIRRTSAFLTDKPSAFVFIIILSAGLMAINVLSFFVEAPLSLVFDNGLLIFLIVALINTVVQSYLMILFWSCIITFYIKASNYKASLVNYDI